MLLGGRGEHTARAELDDRQPWPELEQPPRHLQRLTLADRDGGLLDVADRDGAALHGSAVQRTRFVAYRAHASS